MFGATVCPDLGNNFDDMRSMFKIWDSHSENMHMMEVILQQKMFWETTMEGKVAVLKEVPKL